MDAARLRVGARRQPYAGCVFVDASRWRSARLCSFRDAAVVTRMTVRKPELQVAAPPTFSNKARRALWWVVWLCLFRPSPVLFHFWRRMLLRLFGARVGRDAHPYPSAWVWAPWNLTMGDGSCLGEGVDCYSAAPIVLGTNAIVSQRAYLCAASHDIRKPGMPLLTGGIIIGDGAWVAAEAFVGPGVELGRRGVVAARAVVTRHVPAETVVAGNPATAVAQRSVN